MTIRMRDRERMNRSQLPGACAEQIEPMSWGQRPGDGIAGIRRVEGERLSAPAATMKGRGPRAASRCGTKVYSPRGLERQGQLGEGPRPADDPKRGNYKKSVSTARKREILGFAVRDGGPSGEGEPKMMRIWRGPNKNGPAALPEKGGRGGLVFTGPADRSSRKAAREPRRWANGDQRQAAHPSPRGMRPGRTKERARR